MRQRLLRLPVLVRVRFHARDQLRHIGRIHRVVRDELRQIVLLLLHRNFKVEVRRIHPADAKVRDVPHHIHRHRNIEQRDRIRRLVIQRLHPLGPARRIIVFGNQPLGCRVLKLLDERRRRRRRRAIARPGHLVVAVVVESLDDRTRSRKNSATADWEPCVVSTFSGGNAFFSTN